jgi:organic radical activating enzyme
MFFYYARLAVQRLFGLVWSYKLWHLLRRTFFPLRYVEDSIFIYPTWQCNLKCHYCQNLYGTGDFNPPDVVSLTPETWAESVNNIGRNVVISGGEPFVYPRLVELVNSIDQALRVTICTNLSAPHTIERIRRFSRPVHLMVSYHPCSGAPTKMLQTIRQLSAEGRFEGTVHAVGTKAAKGFLRRTQRSFLADGVPLAISANEQELDFKGSRADRTVRVFCYKKAINIGPDGRRYNCITKAIRREDPICDMTDPRVTAKFRHHVCNDFGFCCPSDMAEPGFAPREITPADEALAMIELGDRLPAHLQYVKLRLAGGKLRKVIPISGAADSARCSQQSEASAD